MSSRFGEVFAVRIANTPTTFLRGMASPELAAWAEQVDAAESTLSSTSEGLVARLEQLVGGEEDRELRRTLINLKRAVFNGQAARAARVLDRARRDLEGAATSDWHGAATQWLHEHDSIGRMRSGAAALLEAYDGQAEHRILSEYGRDDIALSVRLSSRDLDAVLGRLADLTDERDRTDALRGVSEYLYRSATRTTPFGAFTAVALGQLGAHESNGHRTVHGTLRPRRFARPNLELLTEVRRTILATREYRRSLPLSLTDGIAFVDGRVRYIRRKSKGSWTGGNVTSRTEDVFFLKNDRTLSAVFARFAERPEWTFADLAAHVARDIGAAPEDGDVEDYLIELVHHSFIVVRALEISVFEAAPVLTFARALDGIGAPWAAGLADRLRAIDAGARRLHDGGAAPARAALVDIEEEFRAAVGRDLAPAPGAPLASVYVDLVNDTQFSIRASDWESRFGPHMRHVASILPIFDAYLPDKLLLKGFINARYRTGVVDDLVTFAQEFYQDVYDVYREQTLKRPRIDAKGAPTPLINWLSQPEVEQLNSARRSVVSELGRRYQAWEETPNQTLELDEEFFTSLARDLPDPTPPAAYAISGQLVEDPAGRQADTFVINGFYSGLTLLLSRFLHAAQESQPAVAEQLRAYIGSVQPEGSVFAEISGGQDSTNLNLHPRVVRYQIRCPGELPPVPTEHDITLDELAIHVDDAGVPHLWCERLGLRVIPVYLGFLIPYALPDLQRILLLFSPIRVPGLDLWSGVDPPLGDKLISSHPRVTFGPLVLVRKVWKMQPRYVPRRAAFDTEPEWLHAVHRWRRTNGFPRSVFVTTDLPADRGRPSRTKPQFVDFHNPSTLRLLDRMVRGAANRVVLVEALPDPLVHGVHDSDGERAGELVLEYLYEPAGAPRAHH